MKHVISSYIDHMNQLEKCHNVFERHPISMNVLRKNKRSTPTQECEGNYPFYAL